MSSINSSFRSRRDLFRLGISGPISTDSPLPSLLRISFRTEPTFDPRSESPYPHFDGRRDDRVTGPRRKYVQSTTLEVRLDLGGGGEWYGVDTPGLIGPVEGWRLGDRRGRDRRQTRGRLGHPTQTSLVPPRPRRPRPG